MAATNPTQTTRFGIYRWALDTDTFKREQMTTSHERIEARGATIYQGTSLPGSSSGQYSRALWFDTTNRALWYSDYDADTNTGGAWRVVAKPGTTAQISALTISASASNGGVADEFARADHIHQGPGFAAPNSVGTANAAGSATTVSRSDHIHALGTQVVGAANVAASVASDGLQRTNSGLQVKASDGTLTVDPDGVKVSTGIISNTYTTTGARLIHVGTTAPSGSNVATGDLWVDTSNPASSVTGNQIKQYRTVASGDPWTAISVTQRTPAAKFVWTTEFTSSVATEVVVAPFNAMQFPATLAEQELWFPTGITTVAGLAAGRTIKIPYSGYYMLHGNMAWVSKGSGSRQIWLARKAVGATNFSEMDGGQNVVDLPAGGSHTVHNWLEPTPQVSGNYTRAMAWTFASLDAGDLISLVGRTIDAQAIVPGSTTIFSGANLSITYVSAR